MGKKDPEVALDAPVVEVVPWHAISYEDSIEKLRAREDLLTTGLTAARLQLVWKNMDLTK